MGMETQTKTDFILSNHIHPYIKRYLVVDKIVIIFITQPKYKKVEIVYKMIVNNFLIDK